MLRLDNVRRIKANGVPDKLIKKAESIVDEYFNIVDDCLQRYGHVKHNYTTINGCNGYNHKPNGCDSVHHIMQIWYKENLNPKLSTTGMYKDGVPKSIIAEKRNEYWSRKMEMFGEYQKPEYLVYVSKEEHKLLHGLIKEYKKLWLN